MAAEASEVSLEKETGNVEENGVIEKVEENMEDLKLETEKKTEPPAEEEIGIYKFELSCAKLSAT